MKHDTSQETSSVSDITSLYVLMGAALLAVWAIAFGWSYLNVDTILFNSSVALSRFIAELNYPNLIAPSLLCCFFLSYIWAVSPFFGKFSLVVRATSGILYLLCLLLHFNLKSNAGIATTGYYYSAYILLIFAFFANVETLSNKTEKKIKAGHKEFDNLNTGFFPSGRINCRVNVRMKDGSIQWNVPANLLDWKLDIDNPITSYMIKKPD